LRASAGRRASDSPNSSSSARGARSIAIPGARRFVVVIFLVTIVKLGSSALTRPV
jgi:hypothetical protein